MGLLDTVKLMPFLLAFLLSAGSISLSSSTPMDSYFLACGFPESITFQGRTYIPDQQSKVEIETRKFIAVNCESTSLPSIYLSARIFLGKGTYKFKIEHQGWHWVRLYFHPITDRRYPLLSASVTVVTDSFVLLNNFNFVNSPFFFSKEYAINIASQNFALTFIASSTDSPVFVNAIEVISIPDKLFSEQPLDLHHRGSFGHLSEYALETINHLNVGGPSISAEDDTLGRHWEKDKGYSYYGGIAFNVSVNASTIEYLPSITPDIAPKLVYATAEVKGNADAYNLSWLFNLDPNYRYFIRVHFCDIISKSLNELVFNLYVNSDIAVRSLNLSSLTGGLAMPYYKDFVSDTSMNTLTVSVGPDAITKGRNATMSGLEIMKISNRDGSLDGLSSVESILVQHPISRKLAITIGCIFGFLVFIAIGLMVYYLVVHRSGTSSEATLKSRRQFTFQEMQEATDNFDQSLLLGEGGFGKVYKGTLANGFNIAIKIANHESRQGLHEFQNEIGLLSELEHQNLVSLLGHCNEGSEMILVYEYMPNGTLSGHLYGPNLTPLSWKQRLEICIGAAKGLHYLHTGSPQSIIHRDVKTANILLDENFVAKVSDFGISRKGPPLDKSHVTTAVKGSFGYVDPEYFRTKFLTEKSDVFSFGVVLMEVVCGKPALDDSRPTEQMNLANWALSCQKKSTFHQIVDPSLCGKVNKDSLNMVCELAWMCLDENRINRPPMGYVLCRLEGALHLELALTACFGDANPVIDGIQHLPTSPVPSQPKE